MSGLTCCMEEEVFWNANKIEAWWVNVQENPLDFARDFLALESLKCSSVEVIEGTGKFSQSPLVLRFFNIGSLKMYYKYILGNKI